MLVRWLLFGWSRPTFKSERTLITTFKVIQKLAPFVARHHQHWNVYERFLLLHLNNGVRVVLIVVHNDNASGLCSLGLWDLICIDIL